MPNKRKKRKTSEMVQTENSDGNKECKKEEDNEEAVDHGAEQKNELQVQTLNSDKEDGTAEIK